MPFQVLYRQAYDPVTGRIDTNKLYGGLAGQGYGTAIPKMQAADVEMQLKRGQAAKALSEAEAAQFKTSRDELAAVTNQAGYDAWRAKTLSQYGNIPNVDVNQIIPPQFSEATKQSLLRTADMINPKGEVRQIGGATATIDPYTGKQIGTQVADVALPSDVEAQRIRIAQAGRPTTTITTKLEGAEAAGKGALNVKTYEGIRDVATAARALAPKLAAIRSTLDKGFETGAFAPAKAQAAAFLAAIGVKDTVDPVTGKKMGPLQYATDAQTFKAAAQERVLERQLEQKGVQTTSDAARMEQTFARLGNTTEANRFLVDVADAQGKMAIQQQKFWDDWWNKNRTYEGVEQAWNEGPGSKSIFDMPNMGKYLTAGAPISVSAPNGKTYTFPDQASADKFKKAAGIK